MEFAIDRARIRPAFLFRLSKLGLAVMVVVLVAAFVVVALVQGRGTLVQFFVVLGLFVLAAGLYFVLRIPKDPEVRSVAESIAAGRYRAIARHRGWGSWSPSTDLPVPRAVGEIHVMGVSKVVGDPEHAVVRHTPVEDPARTVWTTTLEIGGRGDGRRHTRELVNDAVQLEGLLSRMAQNHLAVDELQVTVRAMPGLPPRYREQLAQARGGRPESVISANTDDLVNVASAVTDSYRTYVTLGMPETRVRAMIGRSEKITRERIADEVHTQAGRVAQFLTSAGYTVQGGLGPRRWGALVRHLQAPSWSLDDLSGIGAAIDGFQPYTQVEDAVAVFDQTHDVTWCHATASVSASMWPATIKGSRWMEGLVTNMVPDEEPSVIRAITTTMRLLTPAQARRDAQADILFAATQSLAERHKITDGSAERQTGAGVARLVDLLEGAAGVKVTTRIMISAPSEDGLWHARNQADEAASAAGIDRLDWADERPGDAMVWTLPLCRGIARRASSYKLAQLLEE
ncbi:hypothetical protein CGZ91_11740 [Parenemella sanctibonifatiensis]|uniref:Uncharacterized protein n=2 Tax=Parenemella sanctibonifatiensis TaxID=2016505 RepID=A0A255EIU6_9ACTN|nr:hypothetical protein CGZ91_11740 [Parenemella sanctibonifatiensis]